jgi:hypothetical protein
VLRTRQYWFDFAGLEGIVHWFGAIAGFVVGVAGYVVYLSGRNASQPNTTMEPTARRAPGT